MISEEYIIALINKHIKFEFDTFGKMHFIGIEEMAKDINGIIEKEVQKLGNTIIKIANATEPKQPL